MSEIEILAENSVNAIKALSPAETEVFDTIIDYLDTLPEGFFEDNSVDELNKHFGGHDDMVVTEKVRKALDAQQKLEAMFDAMAEVIGELPEEDEEL